ncbi:MAG TPA: hypothetical protein VF660_07815 [Actinomycetota bacterium]
MTKRKRKPRRSPAARTDQSAATNRRPERAPTRQPARTEGAGRTRARTAVTATRNRPEREPKGPPVIHPPLPLSLARGMRAAGASPLILAITFLGLLSLWLAYSAYGVDLGASPSGIILLESLPPFHSYLDVQLLAAGRATSSTVFLEMGLAVVVARAALLMVWISLLGRAFDRPLNETEATARPGPRRGLRTYPVLLGIEVAFLVLMLVALVVAPSFLGGSIGQLAVIAALLGGTYFFAFAPVIAVTEGVAVREAFRLSVRAARIPGPRHMVLASSYIAFSLFVLAGTPASRVAAATPSILLWLYALLVAFVHVSVLGALTFRWLVVRESVLEQDSGRARP